MQVRVARSPRYLLGDVRHIRFRLLTGNPCNNNPSALAFAEGEMERETWRITLRSAQPIFSVPEQSICRPLARSTVTGFRVTRDAKLP